MTQSTKKHAYIYELLYTFKCCSTLPLIAQDTTNK